MPDQKETTITAVAVRKEGSQAVAELSGSLGLTPGAMVDMIKTQCFKKRPEEISDSQLAAYVSTANALRAICPRFNPVLPGMLYAFPSRNGGIDTMLGPDGIFALLSTHPDYDGCDVVVEPDGPGKPIKATATIYLKEGKGRARTYTAWYDEWCVDNNPLWKTKPRHMLWVRAVKQCARQIIHGIPMDREEIALMGAVDVSYEDVTPVRSEAPATRGNQLAEALSKAPESAPMKAKAEKKEEPPKPTEPDPAPANDVDEDPAPPVDDYLPKDPPPVAAAPEATETREAGLIAKLKGLIDKVIEESDGEPGSDIANPDYWCEYYSAFDDKKGVKKADKFMHYMGKDEAKHASMMDLLERTIQRIEETLEAPPI